MWKYNMALQEMSKGGYIMKSTEYAAGLAVGIIVALIFFLIIWKFNRKKMKGQFE